ncbi:MAG: carboxypeptidase [Proteobacteria bacterium]|nr:carboxypeptidase [Pseudomonadota bacterium]
MRPILALLLATLASCALAAPAAPAADADADAKAAAKPEPKAEQSVTQHALRAGALSFEYTATAGTALVRDKDDKPVASIGYVAYTRRDARDAARRPVLFAFNGGPGSSSIWLHMGLLGPRRVVTPDAKAAPPAPYTVVDNAYTPLDKADVVLIDPVGTGLSHAVGDKKDEDFWGVDADIDCIGRFIAQYLDDNHRWSSPKYLLGESYGTTRAAGIARYLQSKRNVAFNGVILVSVATDIEALFALPGNDRPYPLYLPAFAATAWYLKALPAAHPDLGAFLDEVRDYARGPFAAAIGRGDALPAAERLAVAQRVHEYTGLSVDYLVAANLRVSESAFDHELLKARGLTVGRIDSRFVGATIDPLVKEAEYDPQLNAIRFAYAAAFLDWYHKDLGFGGGKTYQASNFAIGGRWHWDHHSDDGVQFAVNTGVDLAHALVEDPHLKVLVMNGYFDLATPFSATEYMIDHLGVSAEAHARIRMKYYEAGHMMYIHQPSLERMKADLDAFITETSAP